MEKEKTILDYDTVALDEAQDAVIIIDQTLLPGRIELIALHTAQEIWDAIYLLKVRGAPAIGVAAALGIYLLANRIETEDFEKFYEKFTEYKEYLDSSRPTAVNLSWALKRMDAVAVKAGREEHKTVAKVKEILYRRPGRRSIQLPGCGTAIPGHPCRNHRNHNAAHPGGIPVCTEIFCKRCNGRFCKRLTDLWSAF